MPITANQKQILQTIDEEASRKHWRSWQWQIRHRVRDLETFEEVTGIRLNETQRADFKATVNKFPMSITPYYLSLINADDFENDPVFIQSFPSPNELTVLDTDMCDPLHEDHDSPVPGITHRYPDRVLFLVSNFCAMYCRHCTRKRRVGDRDNIPDRKQIAAGID
ncbi:MAG: lysine 2,3-aminomutase, partial [Actinomycetia bacterium]|nr:lysine 2,3-aminomutase [Actinomycetes bacterium]